MPTAALALTFLGGAVLTNACGSQRGEGSGATSSSEALETSSCTTPFTVSVCTANCQNGPVPDCHLSCVCAPVTGTPEFAAAEGFSCYAAAKSVQLAPQGPPGCTVGVVLAPSDGVPDPVGAILANTWACPVGTTIPLNLGAAPTCDVDPVGTLTWAAAADGATQCEWVYSWPTMWTGTDCFGNANSGYTLVQERIFTTDEPDGGDDAGGRDAGGSRKPQGCGGACSAVPMPR